MIRTAIILALCIPLAGCDFENILTGKKTEMQKLYEAREEQGLPPPVNVWAEPAPLVAAAPEPCRSVFRETMCVGGQLLPFQWGVQEDGH